VSVSDPARQTNDCWTGSHDKFASRGGHQDALDRDAETDRTREAIDIVLGALPGTIRPPAR